MYKRIGLSSSIKLKVLKRDRFTCAYCGVSGADAELHVDHIIPVSKGGSNNIYNLTTACSQCNLKKSNKLIDHPPIRDKIDSCRTKIFQIKYPQVNLLEKAEALLLRIYLQIPEYREMIHQTLIEQDLLFGFAHHRLLWQTMDEVMTQYHLSSDPDNQLLDLVQNQYLEQGIEIKPIESLFQLTETTEEDLFRANLRIPQAIAVMEKAAWEKYGQYCLQQLQQLEPRDQAKDFQYYQQEWMKARQELQRLNNQRINHTTI